MAGIGLKIDPTGEDLANVVLDLNDGTKFRAIESKYPTPEREVNWTSSADTEGALPANLRYQNRSISIICRVYGSSASDLQTQLGYLEQKVGKINDEGATLEYVSPSGVVCIFDLLEAAADYDLDNAALANKRAIVTITLTAKPFWRSGVASEVASTLHKETLLPVIVGVDSALGGDIPALGRLVFTEEQGADQLSVLWGIQSRYYDSSADAELFYQAESRTPQGGAATAELSGASGSGNNTVLNSSLITSYQSVLSTQASGGGNHLKHIGLYRIFARVQRPTTNSGSVTACLEYSQGDFKRATRNDGDAKTWAADELEGVWTLVDLGLVRLDKAVAGAQRWEGRVLAKSTVAGDKIYVDCLMLFPVDEGYGSLKLISTAEIPTTLSAYDMFDGSAGNLDAPRALPLGGKWSEVNKTGAKGFAVETSSHTAQRTEVSDTNLDSGCFALAGTTSYTATQVQVNVRFTKALEEKMRFGVLARYTDIENWLMAVLTYDGAFGGEGSPGLHLSIIKRVAGVVTNLGHISPPNLKGAEGGNDFLYSTVQLAVATSGVFQAWAYRPGSGPGDPGVVSQEAALATGGALAGGKLGIYDAWTSATANTRNFDNFVAFAISASDAVVYASRSAEVRSDRFLRQDSTGLVSVPRTDYKGSYFKPPPARREGRSIRTIVKLSRGNVDTMADPSIDDASFRVYWQSRGLVLPES
jgi:hypothetical protein